MDLAGIDGEVYDVDFFLAGDPGAQFQTVEIKDINAPGKRTVLDEGKYGNKVLFLELDPKHSKKTVELRFQVQRLEKSGL